MPALTGIRFPLALWVVASHLSGSGQMLESLTGSFPMLRSFTAAAWIALGTFFAISGFVLARRYRTTKWSRIVVGRYMIARFARVYPLYLISLLVLAPIMAAAVARDNLGSAVDRAGLLMNYALILQGWARPPVDWNTPAWSLSCEVFFYACFPAVILLMRRISGARVLAMGVLAFAIPVAVRLLGIPLSLKPFVYFGDFMLGVAAAGVYELLGQRGIRMTGRGHWLYVPASIVGIVLLLRGDLITPFVAYDTALRLANGLLVLGLAFGGGFLCRGICSPFALWGGRSSYAIYILHIPLLWWYKRTTAVEMLGPVTAGFLYIAIVILIAGAVCHWYEIPANTYVRNKLDSWLAHRNFKPPQVRGNQAPEFS
jgi:peptidoglycan/LPS O-acetylase OafA/YrhL